MSIETRVQLILARVELIKLKADDYNWQCHVPPAVKQMVHDTLAEIDRLLSSADSQKGEK